MSSLIRRKSCNAEISKAAAACPKCGEPSKANNQNSSVNLILALVIAAGFIWYFLGGGSEQQQAQSMIDINNQTINEMLSEYKISANQGDKTQTCIQASAVAQAYLQAKDEANYKKWKDIENNDCSKAQSKYENN